MVFLFLIILFGIGYYGLSNFYGILAYNTWYPTFYRAYEAGYLNKFVSVNVFIYGWVWVFNGTIVKKIINNIFSEQGKDEEVLKLLFYYERGLRAKKYGIMLLFLTVILMISSVHFDVFDNSYFIQTLATWIVLAPLIIMVVWMCLVYRKFYNSQNKLLDYINIKCDEKLKARDILASHQIN